jgi:hypothetical protein
MIPSEENLEPAWLSEQLAANGIEAKVKSFRKRRIGTGQIGKCLRLTLDYAPGADPAAPATLVLKLPSDDETSRATGVMLLNFLKEVRFYQILQSRLSIRTPRCYYAEIEGQGPSFAILLEDLQPAEQGDQLAGTHEAVARAAVLDLVGLHAPLWQSDELDAHPDWLYASNQADEGSAGDLYRLQLPGFLERFGPGLDADQREIIAAYGEAMGHVRPPPGQPRALVHVDYRLDNLLIDERETPVRTTAVDWQSITAGSPLADVAYFIGAGLRAEARRVCEQALVSDYHAALLAAGVSGYDAQTCWRDYRLGTFAGFGVTVIAAMIVQRTERGDEMFMTMARRHSRHALDHDALTLLRSF